MDKNKNGKIILGLFFVIVAIYVIISRYICFPHINIFKLLITVFFVLMLLEGLRHVDFFEILFSIACICILYSRHLGITAITPFPILIAALFGSIGLTMIFGKKKRSYMWNDSINTNSTGTASEQCNDEHIFYKNSFGETQLYIPKEWKIQKNLQRTFGSVNENGMASGTDNVTLYINGETTFGEIRIFYI